MFYMTHGCYDRKPTLSHKMDGKEIRQGRI